MPSFDRRSIYLWNWFIVISNDKKHRDDPIDPDLIEPNLWIKALAFREHQKKAGAQGRS